MARRPSKKKQIPEQTALATNKDLIESGAATQGRSSHQSKVRRVAPSQIRSKVSSEFFDAP